MARVAIIGAGLAGMVVARQLYGKADITVFEKSRGVGGRMATRYEGDFEFDHGAQFFTARTPEFRQFLEPLIDAGVVANWPASFVELRGSQVTAARRWDEAYPHFVGAPRMNEIGKYLARGLDVRLQTRVAAIERSSRGWQLQGESQEELGCFDWVVLTAPAAQTAALGRSIQNLDAAGAAVSMHACFALLIGFEERLALDWDAALVREADISWISVNSSKPGRPNRMTLVVHSTNPWADEHVDEDATAVQEHLVRELARILPVEVSGAATTRLHRWRYANLDRRRGPAFFLDRETRAAACGDWFICGRVEAAFTSGFALATELEATLAT